MTWITASNELSRTTAHEIGHLLGLRHPHEVDDCGDTWTDPENCYLYEAGDPVCGNWNNLYNTFMAYHGYQVAVSPCQIEIMHGTLEEKYPDYYTCVDCPTSDFIVPSWVEGCQGWAVSGVTFNNQSVNVDTWKIEIWKTSSFCSGDQLGGYYSTGWSTGNTPSDLVSIYPFATGNTYQITFTTDNACGQESQSVQCVYIMETCGGFYFMLSPNPVRSELTVDFELKQGNRALAFSIAGVSNGEAERRVFQEAKHPAGKFQQRIDVSRLRPGLYFFRAEVAGKSYVRQFLVSGK